MDFPYQNLNKEILMWQYFIKNEKKKKKKEIAFTLNFYQEDLMQ